MKHLPFIATPILLAFTTIAHADPRPFTFNSDTNPVGKGQGEYEQWVTYRHRTDEDNSYTRLDFRHEFEYGLADNFDIAVYFANWRYEQTNDGTRTHYDSSSVELVYYHPIEDIVDLGFYNEITVGDGEVEFEQKILVQKDVGNWTFVYNLIFETEIEGTFKKDADTEVEGVLGHTFGVSYVPPQTPGLHFGAEALIESIYEDWNDYEHTVYYGGPKFGYMSGNHWWFTVTPLFQLSSVDDEPQLLVRLIAGWEF